MLRPHRALTLAVFLLTAAGACTGTDEGTDSFDADGADLRKRCGRTACDAAVADGNVESGTALDAATTNDASGTDAGAADASATNDSSTQSDAGASTDAGSGVDSGKGTYATTFTGTENPISESGSWTNGGDVGLKWQNIQKGSGLAFGTGTSAGYDDCIAHLSGFGANHYAEAVVHVASNYDPGDSHEVELLLRFAITANSARGYEILAGWNGAYSQIVRWNGPRDDFTYLSTSGPGFGALQEGDVIRATAVGSTITAYKNGVQVMQATDATWSDGNPGMGFFIRPSPAAVLANYCYTSYSAGNL